MPWKRTEPMDQKIALISDWNKEIFSKVDLAQKYGVSRKTVTKWITRYELEGIDGLKDKSREPVSKPNSTESGLIEKIIEYKKKYIKRGPKKLYHMLHKENPDMSWPCASTIGYWLKKYNLVEPRPKRKRVPPYTEPFIDCKEPNNVWSADYKGQFVMKNKKKCYPLTITDNYSRYVISCTALEGPQYKPTREAFEKAFREYGLPKAIRTDNGTPFTNPGRTGLSRLSIWWIQLGIIPERINKGCPQENGRHERMHRSLKFETLDQPAKNINEQQKIFDHFIYDFNNTRPHEALNQDIPAHYYRVAKRSYPEKIIKPYYDYDYEVRQVRNTGEIRFKGNMYLLTTLLDDQPVGLKQVDEYCWNIYYYWANIGILNTKKERIFSVNV